MPGMRANRRAIYSVGYALIGATVLALALIPGLALAAYARPRKVFHNRPLDWLRRRYDATLGSATRRPVLWLVPGIAAVVALAQRLALGELLALAGQLAPAFERVAVDLADRRGEWIETGGCAGRQVDAGDPLLDPLARPVVLDAIDEHQRDQREPERAPGAHHVQAGDAVERALQRDRDLLLDLLGGVPEVLGHDLRGRVRDVGVGLDRQLLPRVHPERADHQEHGDDQPALAQARGDELPDHCSMTASVVCACSRSFSEPTPWSLRSFWRASVFSAWATMLCARR